MSETVIVALFSFGGTLVGGLAGILVANKLVNYRLQQLEVQVAKHNSVIERTYALEKGHAILCEQVREIKERQP